MGGLTNCVRSCLQDSGDQILSCSQLGAARQRKIVVKACGSSQRDRCAYLASMSVRRQVRRIHIDGIDDFVGKHLRIPLSLLVQPTHPTRSSGMQVKAMAWKPGDDCTASATPRRPCDAWQPFSMFRTHRDASELRIWDLRWRTGSQRNVSTRCSLTVTDDPARHQMSALWRRCSG